MCVCVRERWGKASESSLRRRNVDSPIRGATIRLPKIMKMPSPRMRRKRGCKGEKTVYILWGDKTGEGKTGTEKSVRIVNTPTERGLEMRCMPQDDRQD